MLAFRSDEHVARWCREREIEPGATFALDRAWRLARAWYADRLDPGWRRPTAEEAESVFASVGLTGPFWRVRP